MYFLPYMNSMKNNYFIRIYFAKSYLKPFQEYHIDVFWTEKNRIISKLKRKHYDMFREEFIEN